MISASLLIGILNPKGYIAYHERKLLFDTLALMLIVVLPVIIMSLAFVYHYQRSHRIEDYKPNWGHNFFLESTWWAIPCVIITILAILTWKETHHLDPYRPIQTGDKEPPMIIQAIALPWKWLFIYPAQNVASLNEVALPLGKQVEFWMTTDNAPMSALFIPQLGSQIYAMAGMRTRLHLLGTVAGTYDGMNALYNGNGFSDMHFPTKVLNINDFNAWITNAKNSKLKLDNNHYQQLLTPSVNNPPTYYAFVQPNLFQNVINLYMNTYGSTHPRDKLFLEKKDAS